MVIKIKELLEAKGKTIYWLSKQANINHYNLSRLARNETTSIRFEHIENICKALECTPNELLGWED